jgi:hypothetical protein
MTGEALMTVSEVDELRKRIARIISPKASFEDTEGARDTKFQMDRRRVAYEKADTVIAVLTAALSDQTETIRACARSTLIGFQSELGVRNIEFICDQIARKATMGRIAESAPPREVESE